MLHVSAGSPLLAASLWVCKSWLITPPLGRGRVVVRRLLAANHAVWAHAVWRLSPCRARLPSLLGNLGRLAGLYMLAPASCKSCMEQKALLKYGAGGRRRGGFRHAAGCAAERRCSHLDPAAMLSNPDGAGYPDELHHWLRCKGATELQLGLRYVGRTCCCSLLCPRAARGPRTPGQFQEAYSNICVLNTSSSLRSHHIKISFLRTSQTARRATHFLPKL